MSCGVGHRGGSDLALLWLWCGLAATALIGSLAWELPNAMGAALKNKQTNKQTNKKPVSKGLEELILLCSRTQPIAKSSLRKYIFSNI